MLVVDDLLIRPFFSLIDILHAMAVEEAYDVDAIQDEIKENRLLYELGERDREEYARRKERLEANLQLAEEMHEKLIRGNYQISK